MTKMTKTSFEWGNAGPLPDFDYFDGGDMDGSQVEPSSVLDVGDAWDTDPEAGYNPYDVEGDPFELTLGDDDEYQAAADFYAPVELVANTSMEAGFMDLRDSNGLDLVPTSGVVGGVARVEPLDTNKVQRVARLLARKAHSEKGATRQELAELALKHLGAEHASVMASVINTLDEERGLLGNVYVLASAYPNAQRQFPDSVKKFAKRATYVVGGSQEWGLTSVPEVPWAEAYGQYAPKLIQLGYSVPNTGNPKADLRTAFLAGPKEKEVLLPHRQEVLAPADRISLADATKVVASLPSERGAIPALPDKTEARKRKQFLAGLGDHVRSGAITESEALILHRSKLPVAKLASALATVLSQAKRSDYQGEGTYHTQDKQNQRTQIFASLASQEDIDALSLKKAHSSVDDALSKGLILPSEAAILKDKCKTASVLKRMLQAAIQTAHTRRTIEYTPTPINPYSGTVMVASGTNDHSIDHKTVNAGLAKLASEAGTTVTEVSDYLRAVRRDLASGFVGSAFDLRQTNYGASMRAATAAIVNNLRQTHEGASFFHYIDAESFATSVDGCRKAAKVLGSKLPVTAGVVLECSKCASCPMRMPNMGSGSICSVYGREVVSHVSVPLNIRKANVHAVCGLQSLSGNSAYDPQELGLGGDASEYSLNFAGYGQTELSDDPFDLDTVGF